MKILVLFLVLATFSVKAKDFGVFGETFQIKEADLLEHLQTRLFQMQQDGSLEAESDKIKEKILSNVRTPQAVAGIKHTETERTFEYDPTIELTRDLTDHRGKIFAKKGDMFNPLDVVSLSKQLLFIDGDDEKQIKWAVSKIRDNNISKVILVKGSPLELQKRLNRDIYFDQHGVLTTRLCIKHVPAIVFQASVAPGKPGEKVLTVREEIADAKEEK